MKRIVLFSLITLLLTGCVGSSQKSSVSTEKIISYYQDRIMEYGCKMYSVMDINDDKIPELLIYTNGTIDNEIIAYTTVYSYDEVKGLEDSHYIINVGTVKGRIDANTVLYKMNDGRLLSVYGHMGYEETAYYRLKNDWLVREDFTFRETHDYMSGDKEIEFKECSDLSLFDNYNKK